MHPRRAPSALPLPRHARLEPGACCLRTAITAISACSACSAFTRPLTVSTWLGPLARAHGVARRPPESEITAMSSLPVPEKLLLKAASPQTPLPLCSEGVMRWVWESRYGAMLIEVIGEQVFVNGQRVEPALPVAADRPAAGPDGLPALG
jgi:hypothetical protein